MSQTRTEQREDQAPALLWGLNAELALTECCCRNYQVRWIWYTSRLGLGLHHTCLQIFVARVHSTHTMAHNTRFGLCRGYFLLICNQFSSVACWFVLHEVAIIVYFSYIWTSGKIACCVAVCVFFFFFFFSDVLVSSFCELCTRCVWATFPHWKSVETHWDSQSKWKAHLISGVEQIIFFRIWKPKTACTAQRF